MGTITRCCEIFIGALLEPAAILDQYGVIRNTNQAWEELFESRDELHTGTNLAEKFAAHPAIQEGITDVLRSAQRAFLFQSANMEPHQHGSTHTYTWRITLLQHGESDGACALLLGLNNSKENQLELNLSRSQHLYNLIAENTRDLIKITDLEGKVEFVSPSQSHILGYDQEANVFDNIHPDDVHLLKEVYAIIQDRQEAPVIEIRKCHHNGQWIWLGASCTRIHEDDGTITKILIVSRDITERKKSEQELKKMAYHDYLTDLYNRRKLMMLMESTLRDAERSGATVALLIMDLDRFKRINDTHGHDIGDLVLKEFSKRLLSCKRDQDFLGRLSGDEFAIIMTNIPNREAVYSLIRKIEQALSAPMILESLTPIEIQLKASIGIAFYPDDCQTAKQLMKHADISLYKKKSRNVIYRRTKSNNLRRDVLHADYDI